MPLKRRLQIGLVITATNAVAPLGIWVWHWSLGLPLVVLGFELWLVLAVTLVEVVRRLRRSGRLSALSWLLPVFGLPMSLATIFGGYFALVLASFAGLDWSWPILGSLAALLLVRYLAELLLRRGAAEPEPVSVAMRRGWFRSMAIFAGLLAVAGTFLVVWLARFPVDLPGWPNVGITDLVAGSQPAVAQLPAEVAITAVLVTKAIVELLTISARGKQDRMPWRQIDSITGAKSPAQ